MKTVYNMPSMKKAEVSIQECPNIRDYQDLIDYLHAIVDFLIQKNSCFSQRAFARMIDYNPSFLHQIMARKRKAPPVLIEKIFSTLVSKKFLADNDLLYFQTLVRLSNTKKQSERLDLLQVLAGLKYSDSHQMMSISESSIVNRWEIVALLESVNLKDFEYTPEYLEKLFEGRKTAFDVMLMVEHLIRKGLLTRVGNKITKTSPLLASPSEVPLDHIKQLHKQFISEAVRKMETTSLERRDFSSYTLCIKDDKIKEAKELIKDFRRGLAHMLESKRGDSVFQLNIQFFPILGA